VGSLARLQAGPRLEKIEATLLAINAADDERNPPETGMTDAAMKRVKNSPALSDPGQHRDAWASHHRRRKTLQAATAGPAEDRTATDDVRRWRRRRAFVVAVLGRFGRMRRFGLAMLLLMV
jgi:hypothetical protein